jgi:hypothetical protein
MTFTYTNLDESVELIALIVTAISGYYMYRQGTTSYNDAKNLIIAVHVLFGAVIAFELFGTAVATQTALQTYVIFGTCLILLCVELLTMLAWSVYLPIQKSGFRSLMTAIYQVRTNFLAFTIGTAYIAFVGIYLIVAGPFSYQPTPPSPYPSEQFSPIFLALLFGVLVLFMGYTSTIFVSARRKSNLVNVKRALVLLPLAWIGIGIDLLVFNSFSSSSVAPIADFDISPFGYLIAAFGLAATSTIFRRASLLAGFFESRKKEPELVDNKLANSPLPQTKTGESPFSKKLGLKEGEFAGRKFLLEVDSSTSYEKIVNDFANELLAKDYSVYVFTARGSPIYNALRTSQARFYLLSGTVSYTTVSNVPTEVLVPQNDPAVLLDALQKTLETDPISPIGLVFDNISDFILTLRLETTYKFLKKMLEAVDSDRVTAIFLITAGAHEVKDTSLVKSLFANQLKFAARGFETTRLA